MIWKYFKGIRRDRVALNSTVAGILICSALLAACGGSVQTDVRGGTQDVPEGYPLTIVESSEHRAAAQSLWLRLFEEYGVPNDRRKMPDLEPFTHVPQSMLGTGPIPLAAATGAPLDEERLRLLLRDFIAKNSQLLGVNSANLSLEGVNDAGKIGKRYAFVQSGFAYPIAPPAGRLEFVVSPAGEIIQIMDTAIPDTDLPPPALSGAKASATVVGRTFTYGDIAGRPQSVTISNPAEVTARRLVVYPEQTDAALRIRLAWEIEAGSSLAWTVYVDALTGETIATRQNFQT